jgi:hypothetical protein
MKPNIKNTIIIINLIILAFALLWAYKSNFEYEPIIVALGQFSSLILLYWEGKSTKIEVKKISKSKVSLDLSESDSGEYNVTNVKKDSEIKIKKS